MRTIAALARTTALSVVLIGFASLAQAADGHCRYRQFSPKLQLWYRACEMPATPERCKELVSDYRQQLEYSDGACPTKGALGPCQLGASQTFYYQGSEPDLAKGCQMMQGTWQQGSAGKDE